MPLAISSGTTTTTLMPSRSEVNALVAAATAWPSSAGEVTDTTSGSASPSRTDRGERRPGVAACITSSASCMIWAGIRYPTDSPVTRLGRRSGR